MHEEERSRRVYIVDNTKIGGYLKRLIEKKYPSHRQFCRKYLEIIRIEPTDDELRKMGNKISQIIKGKKGIQITDLPVFTDLLGVSCEEILSAGKVKARSASHVTNYDVAISKDPAVWKKYVEREDKLILNSDEYCKTVIDYILEFKNYKFLRYLFDEGIIWLVDNSGWDGMTYGAGTDIKRREIGYIDTAMPLQIQYQDRIRTQALALAIENKDIEMLDKLCARENPGLHGIFSSLHGSDLSKYYNEDLIISIANADEFVLDYFSQEFEVEDLSKHRNRFIFPYIGKVVDVMLRDNQKSSELLIRRILSHNKHAYEKLSQMVEAAYNNLCDYYTIELSDEIKVGLRKHALDYFSLSEQSDMVLNFYSTGRKTTEFFASNIVVIKGKSTSALLNELIEESNAWYQKIISMKGDEK